MGRDQETPEFLGSRIFRWSVRRLWTKFLANCAPAALCTEPSPTSLAMWRYNPTPFWRTSSFAPSHQFIPPEVDVGVERTGNKSERLLVAIRHSFLPLAFGESGLGLGDIKPSCYFYFLFFTVVKANHHASSSY